MGDHLSNKKCLHVETQVDCCILCVSARITYACKELLLAKSCLPKASSFLDICVAGSCFVSSDCGTLKCKILFLASKKPVEGIGDPGASPGPVNSWSFNAQKRFPGGEGRRSQPRHRTKPEASGPKTNRASFRPCSGCIICLFLSCFCVIYVAIHVNLAFLFVSFFL